MSRVDQDLNSADKLPKVLPNGVNESVSMSNGPFEEKRMKKDHAIADGRTSNSDRSKGIKQSEQTNKPNNSISTNVCADVG